MFTSHKGNHSFLANGSDGIVCNQHQMTIFLEKKIISLVKDNSKIAYVSLLKCMWPLF